jgi:hypothetical protein
MSQQSLHEPGDEKLSLLLRAARPARELPPGFERHVWQRLEKNERRSGGILEQLAGWLLIPRIAAASLVLVLIVSAGAGVARGFRSGERQARDRYVASVDPSYLPR